MTWLLEMKNITKTFGAVKAVDNVSLRLNAGEVVSLCGENGSGKSTLMKVLCGIYPHGSYEGEIIFAGETLQANHIRDTERKGIAIIHQELALVKHLTVLENIFLGAEISRHGLLDYETMTLRCQKLLAQVNLPISPDTRVGDLGLGQQQLVEIAKALNKQVRLLIRRSSSSCRQSRMASSTSGSTAWARWRSSLEKGTSRISEIPATIRRSRRIKISVMSRTLFGNINS